MTKKKGKLLVIDGTSFCYRAYYAIRQLSTSKGVPTNAVYGFITMIRKLLESEQPNYLAICFDLDKPTFRHKQYKEYKAHRKPMPDDLVAQLEPIKEFCRAYRYPIFEKPGYEADDLLGTLAKRAQEEEMEVFIVTGDKDAFQLVNDRVKIMNPHKENLIYDSRMVKKRFDGLGPEKVVEIMALMGDASDNIPGVPGIGEKTAIRLIKEFGSVDNLMTHVGKIKSKTQQELLKSNVESLRLSRDLAKIDTDIDLELDWDAIQVQPPDEKALYELFRRYEFRTLLREVTPSATAIEEKEKRNYQVIRSEKELSGFVDELSKHSLFAFDTETTSADPMLASLVGLSFAWNVQEAYYIPLASNAHAGQGIPIEKVLSELREIFESRRHKKIGQNVKYDWIVLKRHGISVAGVEFDTMIASHLLNPAKPNHNLDDIALEYLSIKKIATKELIGKGKNQITMDQVALEKIGEYACEDADCVFRLYSILKPKLEQAGLEKVFRDVEMPLLEVLAKIEMNGVHIDLKFLKELSEKAGKDLASLTARICEEAGENFNINSTKQLAEILFVKMKIPAVKKTKTGFSTDVSVLERLAVEHKLPKMILEYREKAKLKSTYLDALPAMVNPGTGLIHTSYNQALTATGRLSSSDPNLQNIPIKTEAGREIRKAFIPRKGKGRERQLLSADYSQVELRILAHLSGDKNLRKAFEQDLDIHRFTATLLYNVKDKDVDWEMRNVAKTINFSIIYGKTAFGLSQDLGIPVSEADGFIKEYFHRYASVKDYLEAQKEKARQQGYLTTLLNRRAYFPEINSSNMMRRQFAERAAINAPIQGSAADLVKLAMIQIQDALEKDFPEAFMIMQVHDELVFDVPVKAAEGVVGLVREKMENAYPLDVPLKVDIHTGSSWYKN